MAPTGQSSGRSALFTIVILVFCALLACVAWLSRDKPDRAPQHETARDARSIVPEPRLDAPLDGGIRTGVGDTASKPVEPSPSVSSEPTANDWRQARLDELDRMYKSLLQLGPDSTIADPMELNMFFWLTIAPQLDARGEYEELIPLAKTKIERKPNENVFTFRQRVYHVPMGRYPEFDEFLAFMAGAGGPPNAIPSPDSKPPAFYVSQVYLDNLAIMMHDAQAMIRQRTEPY
jgi:hypothetical protein